MQHCQRSREAFAVTLQAAEAALSGKTAFDHGSVGAARRSLVWLRRLDHNQFDAVCGGCAVRASKALVR
jgi:hypothetical protein